MSFDEEDDRYKLPTHCKFSAHLSNLLARKDSEMALKDKKFKDASDSVLGKLQTLFNKQIRSPLNSDKIKKLLGIMFARFFLSVFGFTKT